MNRMSVTNGVLLAAFAAAAVCGCGRSAERHRPTIENPDASNPPSVGKTLKLAEMSDDDIVVWVDGSALTKKGFDQSVRYIQFQLQRAGRNVSDKKLGDVYRIFCQRIITDFVSDQVLIHEARRRKLLDLPGLEKKMEETRQALAKQSRMTYEKVVEAFPGGEPAIDALAENMAWKTAMIETIPPSVEVTDAVVSNMFEEVFARNAARMSTNEMRRAKLEGFRKEIAAGKADFGDLAERYSECPFKVKGEKGDWGTFRKTDFHEKWGNKKVGDVVMNLAEGEVSDVLEDDTGYSIVKFVEFDERFGKNLKQECRRLSRIFLPKEPLLLVPKFSEMKDDLTAQMKSQGVDKALEKLVDSAKIVYPHGKEVFGAPKKEVK